MNLFWIQIKMSPKKSQTLFWRHFKGSQKSLKFFSPPGNLTIIDTF